MTCHRFLMAEMMQSDAVGEFYKFSCSYFAVFAISAAVLVKYHVRYIIADNVAELNTFGTRFPL